MSDLVERLEPCPFCGGTDDADNAVMEPKVFVEEFQAPIRVRAYQVKCRCGAEAPAAFSRQGAIGEWNRRAESPELARLRSEVERLTELVQAMIDNDPNDDAADGVSVLDVWRKNAHDILQKRPL